MHRRLSDKVYQVASNLVQVHTKIQIKRSHRMINTSSRPSTSIRRCPTGGLKTKCERIKSFCRNGGSSSPIDGSCTPSPFLSCGPSMDRTTLNSQAVGHSSICTRSVLPVEVPPRMPSVASILSRMIKNVADCSSCITVSVGCQE